MTQPGRHSKSSLAVATLGVGLAVFVAGAYLETRNPRTNDEDNFAWCVLAVGTSLIGMGGSLPFARPVLVIVIALASPFIAFALAVFTFWALVMLNAAFRLGL